MHKKHNKNKKKPDPKTIKLDVATHKLLRIFAVNNDFTMKEAIRYLLKKASKRKRR